MCVHFRVIMLRILHVGIVSTVHSFVMPDSILWYACPTTFPPIRLLIDRWKTRLKLLLYRYMLAFLLVKMQKQKDWVIKQVYICNIDEFKCIFKILSHHIYLINFNYPYTRTFKTILELTDVLLCLFICIHFFPLCISFWIVIIARALDFPICFAAKLAFC